MAWGTWAGRELPILDVIAVEATSTGGPRWERIVEATGLPAADVQIALRRLYDNGWIDGINVTSMGSGFELLEIRLLEPALRAVGVWPSDPYKELVTVLTLEIARTSNEQERSRLQKLLDAAIEVGQGVATAVLTDLVKRTTGI